MFEKNRSYVAHQDVLLSLVLDRLDCEDHANILTHLESSFSEMKLQVFQTDLTQSFEELVAVLGADSGYFHAGLETVDSQVLQEVA